MILFITTSNVENIIIILIYPDQFWMWKRSRSAHCHSVETAHKRELIGQAGFSLRASCSNCHEKLMKWENICTVFIYFLGIVSKRRNLLSYFVNNNVASFHSCMQRVHLAPLFSAVSYCIPHWTLCVHFSAFWQRQFPMAAPTWTLTVLCHLPVEYVNTWDLCIQYRVCYSY